MNRWLQARFRIVFHLAACFFSLVLYPPQSILGQTNGVSRDSEPAVDYSVRYEIQVLKLELVWPDLAGRADFDAMSQLREFAAASAAEGDYELATIYMGEILAQIDMPAPDDLSLASSGTGRGAAVTRSFSKAAIFGLDFSEQRYNLNLGLSDSTFIDNQNNPFSGLRMRWSQFRPQHHDLQFSGMFKYSREYISWETAANLRRSNRFGTELRLNQRFDGLDYQRGFEIHYWQTTSEAAFFQQLGRGFRAGLSNEFQYRRYREESESFPTNWRNELRVSLQTNPTPRGSVLADYTLDQRRQRTFRDYDYRDQRWGVQYTVNPSWRSALVLWYQYRGMDYLNADADSTFLSDYRQHYISVDLKLPIYRRLAFKMAGETILRKHPNQPLFTPDFSYLRLEPGLNLGLSDRLSAGAHYLLEIKDYRKTLAQSANLILNENLLAQGIIVTLDYFNFRNLLFTISHTFRFDSYPNAVFDPVPGLSLYTDRMQNSTLMYLSLEVTEGFAVTMVAQHDLDLDREIENNDSRSAIFSLDFSVGF